MHVPTGETITAAEFESRAKAPGFPRDEWVQVTGPPETVARLSQSVRRDASFQQKRRARRKLQKASRRQNR